MRIGKPLRLRPSLIGLGITILLSVGASPTPTPAQVRDGAQEPPGPRVSHASDPVTLTFVFLGCNRIQHSDWKATKAMNPSSANLPQLKQTFRDIARLEPAPALFFFMGDLVVNLEDDDGKVLKKQLDAWTDLFNAGPLAGKITLVPLPGNHEMLRKLKPDKDADKVEIPNPATSARWRKWLHQSGFDRFAKAANGPTGAPPNLDELADDQGELTYSFDLGDVHFVVINTDTLTTNMDKDTHTPHIGWIPLHWIERDIRAAQANSRVRTIFLIGHKPIMEHPQAEEDAILNTTKHPFGDRLQALFQANDKVRAYLCAHEHLRECTRLDESPGVWQVVAGNAGSQLNSKWDPPGGTYFGFSQIKVYASGKLGLINHRRPTPPAGQKYFEGAPVPPAPAQPDPEVVLAPRL
ncbi:MAG: metallophosphoesterase [Planctomycetaceae bacterium]|nr:metallophosphoesterase [Planctomycetaceae bacterium]